MHQNAQRWLKSVDRCCQNFEFLEEAVWNNASLTLTYILISQSWMKAYFSKFQTKKKKSFKTFYFSARNVPKCRKMHLKSQILKMHLNSQIFRGSMPRTPLAYSLASLSRSLLFVRILLMLPDSFPPSSLWHQMLCKNVNIALVDYLCWGFCALNTLYGTCYLRIMSY